MAEGDEVFEPGVVDHVIAGVDGACGGEFGVGTRQEVAVALGAQGAHERSSDQAAMAGNVDFRIQFQVTSPKLQGASCKLQASS